MEQLSDDDRDYGWWDHREKEDTCVLSEKQYLSIQGVCGRYRTQIYSAGTAYQKNDRGRWIMATVVRSFAIQGIDGYPVDKRHWGQTLWSKSKKSIRLEE